MSYSLEGELLTDFGIIAGRAPQSNIAVEGFLDFPKRINKTEHTWDDENGVDPYVSESEIQFGGRDLVFYGYVKGDSKTDAQNRLSQFYSFIDGFNSLVDFDTPRGSFRVYINSAIEVNYFGDGLCSIKITFRQPNVVLSGGSIPTSLDPENVNGIDGVDFGVLGFTVIDFTHMGVRFLTLKNILERPSPKAQNTVNYFREGFQVTRPQQREYTMNGIILADDYNEFEQTVKNLYEVFRTPGTRVIYLPNDVIRLVYVRNGFTVRGILDNPGKVFGLIEINFTEASEAAGDENYLFLADTVGNYVTTTIGQKIVVKL
jgi:hypothetical protein